jgi:hypothetical protein
MLILQNHQGHKFVPKDSKIWYVTSSKTSPHLFWLFMVWNVVIVYLFKKINLEFTEKDASKARNLNLI